MSLNYESLADVLAAVENLKKASLISLEYWIYDDRTPVTDGPTKSHYVIHNLSIDPIYLLFLLKMQVNILQYRRFSYRA